MCLPSIMPPSHNPKLFTQPHSSLPHFLLLLLLLLTTPNSLTTNALTTYNDGQPHIIQTTLDDAIHLRSSSALTLPRGEYQIRAPTGTEAAIRLYMSSALNATGGQIIGCDATSDDAGTEAGAGVIVGSASRAEFHSGTTVRAGNHVGRDNRSRHSPSDDGDNDAATAAIIDSLRIPRADLNSITGQGGDAVVGQYFGSTITIHGGNFLAGRGSASDGRSLHVAYDARADVFGGDYRGSWLARDRGVIVAYGCLSRVGDRLVGKLEDGTPLDVQVVERDGGVVIASLSEGDECKDDDSGPKSSGEELRFLRILGGSLYLFVIIAFYILG
ncbi:hypothetical protein ACHAXS_013079 [Conticribra weissflogii]